MTLISVSNDNQRQGNQTESCHICKSKVVSTNAPFCSKRCADVDLHRWLSGSYGIAASEDDSEGVYEGDE